MSSSEEEDVLIYYRYKRQRRLRRKLWCHPYIERNINCRFFMAANQLAETDVKFVQCYRMSKASYLELVKLLSPFLSKMNTNMQECVSAEERILITLRYLATGCTFVSLSLYFARGETTVGIIVKETTKIIWDLLNDTYMPLPTVEKWKAIADRFEFLWNLPNCIRAIDDGLFTVIEPGYAGRNSDGGIFRASRIKYWITQGNFEIPSPSPLTHDGKRVPLPYYFVGDEAFPLTRYLMRPYPKRTLDNFHAILPLEEGYMVNHGYTKK
ncbi:unnamed protein product [Acanthoscelides obtectus]|uniref:DDE Tnp4 domain-containing protein n=1 Tax=Acanthoscelides obtectus TaxID=200917 RepID=A0A9P0LPP1_ACAOB|nr:unnamed protein product [Acanthoscelides obtectus]CAK1627042.1 hypothetical protein AOBTE_LOCUS4250 [Acanthoscelides obtectus]